jgi:hypothetical protein
MSVRTSAGTTLHVAVGSPANFTVSGYEALSFVLVGEITNLGEFGRVYALVTHNPIGSRGTVKKKGSFNEGQMALQLGSDIRDSGQQVMKAAANSDNDYSFKVTSQGLDKYYFQAQVMQWKLNFGSVDQITSASANLELTTSSAGVGILEDLVAY